MIDIDNIQTSVFVGSGQVDPKMPSSVRDCRSFKKPRSEGPMPQIAQIGHIRWIESRWQNWIELVPKVEVVEMKDENGSGHVGCWKVVPSTLKAP